MGLSSASGDKDCACHPYHIAITAGQRADVSTLSRGHMVLVCHPYHTARAAENRACMCHPYHVTRAAGALPRARTPRRRRRRCAPSGGAATRGRSQAARPGRAPSTAGALGCRGTSPDVATCEDRQTTLLAAGRGDAGRGGWGEVGSPCVLIHHPATCDAMKIHCVRGHMQKPACTPACQQTHRSVPDR